LFLLGRTLDESVLSGGIPIALGSDSAVTAAGDLLDEIKMARAVSGLPASAIHRMVTVDAARILRLPNGAGTLAPGCHADLIAVRKTGDAPSLVFVGGKLKLAAPALARHLASKKLRPLHVEGRGEFLVDAGVQLLHRQAARALGDEIRLAGRRVLA
jgi:cytosine/adenosine deaminase-related metal-dependent hydrolase